MACCLGVREDVGGIIKMTDAAPGKTHKLEQDLRLLDRYKGSLFRLRIILSEHVLVSTNVSRAFCIVEHTFG